MHLRVCARSSSISFLKAKIVFAQLLVGHHLRAISDEQWQLVTGAAATAACALCANL